jgi:hypothetical protein
MMVLEWMESTLHIWTSGDSSYTFNHINKVGGRREIF